MVADGEEADAQVQVDNLDDLMKELGDGEDTSDSVKKTLEDMTHEQADIYVAYATVPGG